MIRWLLVVALLLPVLAACSTHSGRDRPAPDRPAAVGGDGRAVLAASTADLAAGNYNYTVEDHEMVVNGTVDRPSRSFTQDLSLTGRQRARVKVRVIDGDDKYTQANPLDGQWRRVDQRRIPQSYRMGITNPDLTGATGLIGTVRSATRDGSTITGELDPRAAPPGLLTLQSLQLRLTAPVPFTATLDDQGRLTQLVLTVPETTEPNYPAGPWTLKIAGYGTTPVPRAPAKFVSEPDSFYELVS